MANLASNIIGNRNSTPETSSSSTLRPPTSRSGLGPGHVLRPSLDDSRNPASYRNTRPASEAYLQQGQGHGGNEGTMDTASQQWIADIDQCENTLEEMAAATLDQDFKDELSAIEQWFRVLSEAERTAALYALLQQTTQVQIRFFIGVLQQMAKSHPMSGVLSPANFGEKDPMSNRLSSAMSKLGAEGNRGSVGLGRPPPTPGAKRNSGLDPDQVNSMFPDAAAAIAKQKAEYTQHTGTAPPSNRNSAANVGERTSLVAPTISAPPDEGRRDNLGQPTPSPWGKPREDVSRPKSSSGQQPMGQFAQPPPSAGLRSPRVGAVSGDSNIQTTTLNPTDLSGMPLLSPMQGSWASAAPTPMMANFPGSQSNDQGNLVASATAMKLAALSTVNNRLNFDDPRKYRRSRSSEGQKSGVSQGYQPTAIPANFIMTNELGQVLSPQQAAALQAQQLAAINGRRSRPTSPAPGAPGSLAGMNFGAGPQNNGFLSAYSGNNDMLVNGMQNLGMGSYGMVPGQDGFYDPSSIERGRSPRGRRGTSKPPEDPTDMELLQDIPTWLRSLRLHKYTDNLKDLRWQELIMLDDEGLEKRGVNARGARSKMLKVFQQVREAQDIGKL